MAKRDVQVARDAVLRAVLVYGDACCRGNEYDNRSEEQSSLERVRALLQAFEAEVRRDHPH